MQQIFRRIKRILEAEKNFGNDYVFSNSEDDELKRIIEELNSGDINNKNNEKKSENNSSKTNSSNHSIEYLKAVDLLGVKPDADENEIRSAYIKKIKEYHPDKVHNLGEEIRKVAEKKAKEINQAYEYIKNYRNFK